MIAKSRGSLNVIGATDEIDGLNKGRLQGQEGCLHWILNISIPRPQRWWTELLQSRPLYF